MLGTHRPESIVPYQPTCTSASFVCHQVSPACHSPVGTSITLPLQVQRLDATSRSPIQALIVESLQGASTIRAFGLQASEGVA
jgi:hypothetical protein